MISASDVSMSTSSVAATASRPRAQPCRASSIKPRSRPAAPRDLLGDRVQPAGATLPAPSLPIDRNQRTKKRAPTAARVATSHHSTSRCARRRTSSERPGVAANMTRAKMLLLRAETAKKKASTSATTPNPIVVALDSAVAPSETMNLTSRTPNIPTRPCANVRRLLEYQSHRPPATDSCPQRRLNRPGMVGGS